MSKTLTQTNGYKTLLARIRKEIQGLEFLVKRQTVLSYWRVGKYISQHLLANKERAGYGQHLYEQLAGDLPVSSKTLERTAQFYRTYPIATNLSELGWSHFLYLLTVKDGSQRKLLEQQAVKGNWKLAQLKERIEVLKSREEPKETIVVPQLTFTKGRLNCFRLLGAEILATGVLSGPLIDLGFQVRTEFPEAKALGLEAGDCVEVTQKGQSYARTTIELEELFTYRATVRKIIDADTLWALIDIGFGMFIRQKLRLRGIDCPEISTPQGVRAKKFVQEQLNNLDFIIIKTHKDQTEKYGRYLVDVFYLPGEENPQSVLEEGIFLNQQLLDQGLAKISD